MKSIISLAILIFVSASFIKPQKKNKGVFVEPKDGFYKEIEKGIDDFKNPNRKKKEKVLS
ncbi:MAG: hypothetical protein IPI19_18850 [Ignavibacteriales bacterium]|nr:hypothetical protein [Ignavibacteriales bacterium]